MMKVACGSGLELIYEFLLTDEMANRPDVLKVSKLKVVKVENNIYPLVYSYGCDCFHASG